MQRDSTALARRTAISISSERSGFFVSALC